MSKPSSNDHGVKLPETAHEDAPEITRDQASGQAPPYAYDHGVLVNYNLAASYTTVYGDSTDRDWQDVTLLFVGTFLKVIALNNALYQTYQAGDAHAFAVCDDFTRNFHKCLQDRIAALACGEAHNVPDHEHLPGPSMMRWAAQNTPKAMMDAFTQTMEDDDPPHSVPDLTVGIPSPNIESSRNEHPRVVAVESTGTATASFDDDEVQIKQRES